MQFIHTIKDTFNQPLYLCANLQTSTIAVACAITSQISTKVTFVNLFNTCPVIMIIIIFVCIRIYYIYKQIQPCNSVVTLTKTVGVELANIANFKKCDIMFWL